MGKTTNLNWWNHHLVIYIPSFPTKGHPEKPSRTFSFPFQFESEKNLPVTLSSQVVHFIGLHLPVGTRSYRR